jgi:hypothetical protein
MSKRLTLSKLMTHIMSISKKDDSNDTNNIGLANDIKYLDEMLFATLNKDEQRTIGDFPEVLKKLFDPFIKNFKRHGVMKQLGDLNVSLLYSVLYCLVDDFRKSSVKVQEEFIQSLKVKLVYAMSSDGLFGKLNYSKFGWNITEVKRFITQCNNNYILLQVLADYFNINIFLLSIMEDKIYAIYKEPDFNIFKINIFLTYFDNTFEPLSYDNSTQLNYANEAVKKLANVDKVMINIKNIDYTCSEADAKTFRAAFDDLGNPVEPTNVLNEPVDGNNFDEFSDDGDNQQVHLNDSDDTDSDYENKKKNIFYKKAEQKNVKIIKPTFAKKQNSHSPVAKREPVNKPTKKAEPVVEPPVSKQNKAEPIVEPPISKQNKGVKKAEPVVEPPASKQNKVAKKMEPAVDPPASKQNKVAKKAEPVVEQSVGKQNKGVKKAEVVVAALNNDLINLLSTVSAKMKLDELQNIATTANVPLHDGTLKTGKPKSKPKLQLFNELTELAKTLA